MLQYTSPVTVVIPAAGTGTRLGAGIPKCLVRIGGRTILDQLLSICAELPVILVAGFAAEKVQDEVDRFRTDAMVVTNPDYGNTGVAHSIALAARVCAGDLIVLYGDTLVSPSSLDCFLTSTHATLVGYSRTHTNSPVGVCVLDGGVIDVGRDVKSDFEWSGPVRLPSELARRFSDGNLAENLRPHLPVPGIEISCWEIDDEEDLALAPAWMAANGLT